MTIEVNFSSAAPLNVDFAENAIDVEFTGGAGGAAAPTYDRESDYDSTELNFLYTGAAIPGSVTSDNVWKISRFDMGSGVIEYANGNQNFTNEYDNRESLSYT